MWRRSAGRRFGGQSDRPDAGARLGRADRGLTLAPDHRPLDPHGHRFQVQVLASQLTHLAPAETAPGGEQDQRPVLVGHVLHDHGDLFRRRGLGLEPAGHPRGVRDLTGVLGDQRMPARAGTAHDARQQRIGMGATSGCVRQQLGVPFVHVVGRDVRQRHGAEHRQDLLVQQGPVEIQRPRLQRLTASGAPGQQPTRRVLRQRRGHRVHGGRGGLPLVLHDLGLAHRQPLVGVQLPQERDRTVVTLPIGTEVARLVPAGGQLLDLAERPARALPGGWPRWGDRVTHRFRALTRPRKLPLGHALGILSILLARWPVQPLRALNVP